MPHLPAIALFALATIAAPTVPEAAPSPPTAETPEMLDTARDMSLRMTVPTHVNGHGPYAFTIDTGADRSVVSDSLAQELGLPADGKVIMNGIVGPQSVGTVRVDLLQVGRGRGRAISAPVLPERTLGATGFLGIDAMAGQSVILDFRRNRITLTPSKREENDPNVIVVTGRSRFGQLILTDARVKGVKVYAIVDTGAQNTIGNLALRRLLGRTGAIAPGGGMVIGVTGATLPAELSAVPRIHLGGLTLGNMPIAFADVETFRKFGVDGAPAILLGMDVLRGFERVAVDFRRREVRFLIGDGAFSRS